MPRLAPRAYLARPSSSPRQRRATESVSRAMPRLAPCAYLAGPSSSPAPVVAQRQLRGRHSVLSTPEKHAALRTALEKQRHSENSLWPWVVKYPLLNGDKLGHEIDREWSRDGCEAIGSGGWPWVAAETAVGGRITQNGKQARRSCSGGRWRPEMGGLGRQGTGDEVVKKWWPEVERRRRIGAKSVEALEGYSGQTAGRLGLSFGGVVRRRETKRMGPVASQMVAGRRWAGREKVSAVREREERERARGGGRRGKQEEKKEKEEKEKEKKKKRRKKRKRKKKKKGKRKRDVGKRGNLILIPGSKTKPPKRD
ncbi:hypothetical protein CIPAW_09G175500 [Carya illinoinensis]|uniref:Uncharacterized protein n=1 Tax=Carya illinoinensis TaxID=32201 RepID=A0A8T1PMG0_CARIL|nr:hypothetical protein CIPAW_09G175500 [Carya illinoinensis]